MKEHNNKRFTRLLWNMKLCGFDIILLKLYCLLVEEKKITMNSYWLKVFKYSNEINDD